MNFTFNIFLFSSDRNFYLTNTFVYFIIIRTEVNLSLMVRIVYLSIPKFLSILSVTSTKNFIVSVLKIDIGACLNIVSNK